jgi:hypothetical protein
VPKNVTNYDATPPPTRLADRMQLRWAFSTDEGEVTEFVVQLEYWLDGDWTAVVRYDHNPDLEAGHDVTVEGVHRDVYRDGEKVDAKTVTGPIPASDALNYAQRDLRENPGRYIRRFEQWHNVSGPDTTDL